MKSSAPRNTHNIYPDGGAKGLPESRFWHHNITDDDCRDLRYFAEECQRFTMQMIEHLWAYTFVRDDIGRNFERGLDAADSTMSIVDRLLRELYDAADIARKNGGGAHEAADEPTKPYRAGDHDEIPETIKEFIASSPPISKDSGATS